MRITPLDIRKQEFRKTMRGLDADEVYAFLTTVAEEYEAVLSNNKNLRERIVDLEGRLQEYNKIETNLRNTLLTAERVTNETKENARREASLIVREAEVEAEKAAETIRAHTQELRREVLELKRQKDGYLTRFKTLLESHHRVLDGFQEDFANIDKEIEEIGQQVEEDLSKGVPAPRISRQKITEEFGRAPNDKVTWGDEPRREEAPRPSMPKQGAESRPAPGENAFPPDVRKDEFTDEGTKRVSDAQTSLLADREEDYGPGHTAAGTAGAMGAIAGAFRPESMAGPAAQKAAGRPEKDVPPQTERNSEEVRRSVARSIEEQLYPEAGRKRVENETVEQAETPAGMEPPREPPSSAERRDDWKQYDIEGKKTDWKGYNIEGEGDSRRAPEGWTPPRDDAGRRPVEGAKSPHGVKRSAVPDDIEVEEALSGLKEASMRIDEETSAGEVVSLDEEAEDRPRQPRGAEPKRVEPKAAEPKRVPSGGPGKKDDAEWSIEELRKNLSNLNRDEGH